MSLVNAIAAGLAMGIVFGFALEKSRVFEPGIIVGQMRLRNFTMLRIFLAAVASGAVVLAAMVAFGGVKLAPKATLYAADIVGGLLLGAGIALAGACPGTVLAQVGAGYRDAWFTLAGGLVGALTFSYAEPALKPLLLEGGPGKLTFHALLNLPFAPSALALAAALILGLVGLERWRGWRSELGPRFDGESAPARDAGTSTPAGAALAR